MTNEKKSTKMERIEIKPFHISEIEIGETDLVLSNRRDITDFVALGFFCLYTTITTPEKGGFRVSYQNISEQPDLEEENCKSIANGALFCICSKLDTVFKYAYGSSNSMFGICMATVMSLHTTTQKKSDILSALLPEEFDINDCVAAQELVVKLIQNRAYTM